MKIPVRSLVFSSVIIALIGSLFIAAIAIFLFYRMGKLDESIARYEGDGTIVRTASHWAPFGFFHGFTIGLDSIDFRKSFAREYQLRHLPEMPYYSVNIGLSSQKDEQTLRAQLPGILSVKARTSSGEIIFDCSGQLSELRHWRFSSGAPGSYELYYYYTGSDQLNKKHASCVGFSRREIGAGDAILLHVEYVPGKTEEPLIGILRVSSQEFLGLALYEL